MEKGGPSFGFCPAKVLRDDYETSQTYRTLVTILETGSLPDSGGINDQDPIWGELVSEFGPYRRKKEFFSNVYQIATAAGLTGGANQG